MIWDIILFSHSSILLLLRSVLSELKYFDVTSGSLMPDVMHDVLEGVLQFEAKLLLRQFIHHDHYFTLAQLNQQIEALELGFSEVKNRPTPISHATLQEGDNHLKQSGKWLASHFCSCSIDNVVSFPDPAFTKDKGLAHFARNLGLADSALPEIWGTNQIAYTC